MRNLKKHAAKGLVAAMAISSILGGCGTTAKESTSESISGSSTEKKEVAVEDMPVVQVVASNGAMTDNTPAVQEKVNEILAKEAGVQVNITWLGWGAYKDQMNLMLTGEGEADLIMLAGFSLPSLVDSGQLYDFTDLYEKNASVFTDAVDSAYLASGEVNGRRYAVPCNNNFSGEACVIVNRQMADELGFDLSDEEKIWSLDEIHDMAAAAVEKYPDIYGVVPQSGSTFLTSYTWDTLADGSAVGVVEDCGKSGKVVSITECEDYLNLARTMRTWYQEGLIMQDVVSNTETLWAFVPSGKAFCGFNNGGYPNGTFTEDSKYYTLSLMKNCALSSSTMKYAIAGNSQNPEAAFEVLKELYGNAEIENLLCWGIEGENYVLDDQGRATLPDGVTSESNTYTVGTVNPWVLPNMHLTYDNSTTVSGFYKLLEEYDENAEKSPCLGCTFDSTPVADEYAACVNVMSKYLQPILCGAVDTDESLEAFKAELKTAGEEKVIAEKQKQLDAFLSE